MQALEEIHSIAPGCLESEPDMAFKLQLARFHARAAAGDTAGAVGVSRACLTPITKQHPHLEPLLKARSFMAGPITSSSCLNACCALCCLCLAGRSSLYDCPLFELQCNR